MFSVLSDKFSSIFKTITGENKISAANIQTALSQVHDALLEADVPLVVVEQFMKEVEHEALGERVLKSLKPSEQFIKLVHEKIKKFLGDVSSESYTTFKIPSTFMVLGLQGSGKTTSLVKIAHFIQDQAKKRGKSRKILVASVDFYRPAAIDQLQILAEKSDIDFYRSIYTTALEAARDIALYAKKNSYDHLLLDTAGRLHVDNALLAELQSIDVSVQPDYKILVLDAMTGQESLRVAQAFQAIVPFDYAVLTKMDSDTRGGAAFSFCYMLKKPILFVGTGEKVEDLEVFHPDRAAGKILGMGDILSLVEQAESKIKKEEQERATKAFMSGKMTLDDFIVQIEMLEKMGSLSKIAGYMPGLGGLKLSEADLKKGERELKKFKAIIQSMTKKERIVPAILDSSRKARIAKGSGTAVSDINLLLNRFEQSQQFAKMMKRYNKFGNFFS